jgi:aminopeptidase N
LARTEFEPSPKMSSYLVALVISDFKCLSTIIENIGESGSVNIRMCARPSAVDDGLLDFAFQSVPKLLKSLEELLDIKYPLPKLGNFETIKCYFAIVFFLLKTFLST